MIINQLAMGGDTCCQLIFTPLRHVNINLYETNNYPYFSILSFLTPTLLTGQKQLPPGCDGTRFIDEVFGSAVIYTVQYGQNLNNGIQQPLIMDIYEPEGDNLTDRPVIILAHGGYFIFGGRGEMADLCQYFAKRGYVAATIDYRKLLTVQP